jgi:DNA helicase-2/ATP-dependent DNA helicase PcrA
VRLERNYRSDPAILGVANALMRGRPAPSRCVGSFCGPVPSVTAYDDDQAEAEGVATAVAAQLASGIEPNEIAVLYRANAQSAPVLSALAARGIAATVLGGKRFFDCPKCVRRSRCCGAPPSRPPRTVWSRRCATCCARSA